MSETLGFDRASWNQYAYNANYTETFRSHEVPDFDPKETEMFKGWVESNDLGKIALYLQDPKFSYCLDDDLVIMIINSILEKGE